MALKFHLTIRDPVHGHMRFTALEKRIIDLPVFQRLRGLKQSSLANYTYPTALTTRFEHSLGAAHMGHRIVEHIFLEFPDESEELVARVRELHPVPLLEGTDDTVSDCVIQAVRLSCLLHDLGHLPFSHCFEADLTAALEQPQIAESWGRDQANDFRQQKAKAQDSGVSDLKLHEYIGYAITRDYQGIADAARSNAEELALEIALDILNPVHSGRGLDPVFLKVLGRIVHGEVDADRMDFILRDSSMAGTGWGHFDPSRLIRSLVLQRNGSDLELMPSARGISELESFFVSRLAVYRWQYHHHNVVYYDLLLRLLVRELLSGGSEIADFCGTALIDELAYRHFIGDPASAGAGSSWIMRDDGLVWGMLGEVYRNASATPEDSRSDLVRQTLVILNELLLRSKRHVTLWKDHLGYREFADIVLSEFEGAIQSRNRLSIEECRERIQAWCSKEPIAIGGLAERVASELVKRIETVGFDKFQYEVRRRSLGTLLVDYRRMSAFRRLPVSRLSELRVCARDGRNARTVALGDVSDILKGMGDPGALELRLFAYKLVLEGECPSGPDKRAACMEARGALARAMVSWTLETAGVLSRAECSELEIVPALGPVRSEG